MARPSGAISACSGRPGFNGGGEGVPQEMAVVSSSSPALARCRARGW
jgi:hypothetical protein